MPDNIPFEIQIEIIKRLPVESLIRFRSISKAWKSLIDSSDFITRYSGQQQHLLVSYKDEYERKYVSIVDDDTFPHQRVPAKVHLLVNMLKYPSIIGSSHGLLCLYGRHLIGREGYIPRRGIAVVWNFSLRKAFDVVVPTMEHRVYKTVIGFGVCRETSDPKILKINYLSTDRRIDRETISSIPCQVEVFALSTGVWRPPYSSNLPRKSIRFSNDSAVVDGIVYWLVDDMEPGLSSCNLIVSFDTTSEEFREVNLPGSLAHSDQTLFIFKLRESLAVLEGDDNMTFLVVWMMQDGVSKSFTKVFTINTHIYAPAFIHEFRKSGEPIFEVYKGDFCSELVVFEPYSKHFVDLGIDGPELSFSVSSYLETLLLLDQPDLTVYNDNKAFKYRDDLFQELGLLSN